VRACVRARARAAGALNKRQKGLLTVVAGVVILSFEIHCSVILIHHSWKTVIICVVIFTLCKAAVRSLQRHVVDIRS